MDLPAEFRPEISSRRGEITAWGLTLLAATGWMLLVANNLRAGWLYIFLTLFLLLSSLAISLTNFVERHTILRLEPDGLSYENGLRHTYIAWNEIHRIQIEPGNLGDFVRVFGADQKYFSFRTFGEVIFRGQSRGRVGFTQGDQIVAMILEKGDLKQALTPPEGMRAPKNTRYYLRR